ncbi:MAG: N5-glutamine methyltransferase family protein, partial [Spirochaetota bacterium]
MITVQDVLQQGTRLLKKHSDSQTPYLDAILLMGNALKKSKEQVLASLQDSIWEVDALAFGKSIELRIKGRPVAYMLRKKEFYGLEFYVDSRVLIPRPDTELLVELAIETAKASSKDPYRILDLCAGSGCIGIAVYHALTAADAKRSWEVTLSDISKEALAVCGVNSRSITGRELPTVCSNLFETVSGSFDLIITNPPYLTDQECSSPQVQARREPDIALRSGPDG